MRLPCQQAGLPQSSMWDFSSIVSGCGCRSSARRCWKCLSRVLSFLFFFLLSFLSFFFFYISTSFFPLFFFLVLYPPDNGQFCPPEDKVHESRCRNWNIFFFPRRSRNVLFSIGCLRLACSLPIRFSCLVFRSNFRRRATKNRNALAIRADRPSNSSVLANATARVLAEFEARKKKKTKKKKK